MQKKKMNRKKLRVYLAGQITKNHWRCALYKDNARYPRNPGETISSFATEEEFIYSEYDAGEFIVTGPHSISCDHSCFHDTKHAALGNDNDCCLELTDVKHTICISFACMDQIRRSDIVFCYIESKECYGTLAEIGYACGLGGKQIYLVFKNEIIRDELWFVADMVQHADGTVVTQGDGIRKEFMKALEEYNTYYKH